MPSIDLDHCRDAVTGSVDWWAQLMLEQALHSYAEITPSGYGLRIWGTAAGDVLHRKFPLDTGDEYTRSSCSAPPTRRSPFPVWICVRAAVSATSISLMDWCVFFGEKHKPAPTAAAAPTHLQR